MPWEGAVEEAYERKRLKYAELATDAQHKRLECEITPSGSRLQMVRSHLNIKASQGDWSARKGPLAGSQRPLHGCGKGKTKGYG